MGSFEPSDLTVIIPTRNRWDILRRTLQGLQQQSVQGFETIVVVDGRDQDPPPLDARVIVKEHAGPGAARNTGAHASERELVLLLGDDMVPTEHLVARHLARHALHAEPEAVVLGRVDWHPDVRNNRLLRWMDWSGTQFDFDNITSEEAGFGRFYSCNVSIKRRFFLDAGGFDEDFVFDYEDLDCGWRLAERGMRLLYEPKAQALHLHDYDWAAVVRRWESRAGAERLMAAKHPWFSPWFHERVEWAAQVPPVSPLWPRVVDLVPRRLAPIRRRVERRANLRYLQLLAPPFLAAWEADREGSRRAG